MKFSSPPEGTMSPVTPGNKVLPSTLTLGSTASFIGTILMSSPGLAISMSTSLLYVHLLR